MEVFLVMIPKKNLHSSLVYVPEVSPITNISRAVTRGRRMGIQMDLTIQSKWEASYGLQSLSRDWSVTDLTEV